jgi:two-component system, sensor histidine kinase and response regulator
MERGLWSIFQFIRRLLMLLDEVGMKKILVIEDDKDVRENIVELLTAEGYQAFEAVNGEEGYRMAFDVIPDLVICDILMPVLDGYGALGKFLGDKRVSSIPFILLTALSDSEHLRKGMEMGADDYLVKPFTRAVLLQTIDSRLNKTQKLRQFARDELHDIQGKSYLLIPYKMMSHLDQIIKASTEIQLQQVGGEARSHALGDTISKSAKEVMKFFQDAIFLNDIEGIKGDAEKTRELNLLCLSSIRESIVDLALMQMKVSGREEDIQLDLDEASLWISEAHFQRIVEEAIHFACKISSLEDAVILTGRRMPGGNLYELNISIQSKTPFTPILFEKIKSMDMEMLAQYSSGLGPIIANRILDLYGGSFNISARSEQEINLEIVLKECFEKEVNHV